MYGECVAMILAGGQGSRLGALTRDVAKPAVPFGGKYRIIDFPLSNCVNSGIQTVGVLTQYQPLELNTYIGNGQPWDLDRSNGGAYVLPPYQGTEKGEWYKGTANAIYQNMNFISQFDPKYVLILSGDHIYKMNYRKMVEAHQAHGAACTIAVIPVPWEEAGRFGIMNTNEDDSIREFEEKPANPRSNLASMGVYVFNWQVLRDYLIKDEQDPDSSNDFGKKIIPAMLAAGEKLYAHRFDGYWKDVGTVQSLWEANMDLLADPPEFQLKDKNWPIFSRNAIRPPHFVSGSATIRNSAVTEGCLIEGTVTHSILFDSVDIAEGAVVEDSILLPGVKVGKGAVIKKAIVGDGCVIGAGARVGVGEADEADKSQYLSAGITLLGNGVHIRENRVVGAESMITDTANEEEGGN